MILYKIIHYYIWWNPEIKSKIMPKYDTQEQDIRVSMSVFFLALAIMLYLHLELALGAFIAGVFIATFFSYKIDLPKKLEHFGFGWLVPIFFVWVGTTFDLKSLFLSNLIPISLSVVLFVMFVRIISSIIFINDIGLKNSLLLSLGHSMPLTLIVAVATLALNNNSISEFYYYVFILSAILEVIISMILIKLLSLFKQPLIKDEGF
jgi:Kef-type K+ transport system membrane component KefB